MPDGAGPDAAVPVLLELDTISTSFGRVVVADSLSLSVGAGKSSLSGLIAGDLSPSSGKVIFAGATVTRKDAATRCRLGIGRTFQVPKPFGAMTVFENVLVAVQQGAGLRRRQSHAAAAAVLDLTGLAADANSQAERLGLLSRKRLEVARALATRPSLLLLDEVAGGLTDPEVAELAGIVRAVSADGVAILWIEHVVHALTATVGRLLCLAAGSIIGDGEPEAVLALPAVREVFLGTGVSAALRAPGQDRV